MNSERVRVTIFGKEYPFKGDEDTNIEAIKRVAGYVDSKMAELQKLSASKGPKDPVTIAVLTALNIALELFETKAICEAETKKAREYEEKIKAISAKIDGAKKAG